MRAEERNWTAGNQETAYPHLNLHNGIARLCSYCRLLTLLLLYRSGFMVGKYISLEMLIEDSRADYYEALQTSSALWHENGCDMRPYVEYTLGIILKAYRELESRVKGLVTSRMSKAARIRAVVDATLGKVTKRDILAKCPDISTSMVEMTLKALLDDGVIRKIGNGRAAAYVRND